MAEEPKQQPTWDDPKGVLPPKKPISYKATYQKHKIWIWLVSVVVIAIVVVAAWPHNKPSTGVVPTPTPTATVAVDTLAKVRTDVEAIRAVVQGNVRSIDTIGADLQNIKATSNDISAQLNSLRSQITQLQNNPQTGTSSQVTSQLSSISAQVDALKKLIDSYSTGNAEEVKKIADLTNKVTTLTAQLDSFKQTIGASTSIGVNPTTINGLTVTILAKDYTIPSIVAGTLYSPQMTVKIANSTGKKITNLDILGAISFSQYTYGFSAGYPTLVDSASIVPYVYGYDGAGTMKFEVYQNASGKAISLDAGASITLRPKVGMMLPYSIGSETVTLTITAISYDVS